MSYGPPADQTPATPGRRTLPSRENDVLAEVCRAIVQGGSPSEVVQECAERLQRYFRTASVGIWFRRDDRLLLEGACLADVHGDEVATAIRERWSDVPVESDLPVPRCMRSRSILRWASGDSELAPSVREDLAAIDAAWLVAIPVFVDAEPVGGAVVVLPERTDLTAADELLLEQALGVVGVVYTRGMLQELELRHRDRALESRHLSAVGELAAGVAHQVNNPLNSIVHLAALILSEAPGEPIRSWVDSTLAEARRAARAMKALRLFARPGTGEIRAVDPARAVDEVLSVMQVRLDQENVTVTRIQDDDVAEVRADPDRLRHVLHAVLENARDAVRKDGAGEIRIELRAWGEMVEIAVEDTGPGMTAAVRDAVFRPFFTTRDHPSGGGMGLALAGRMVSEWDGEMIPGNWGHPRAERGERGDGGARVVIRLPRATDADRVGAARAEPAEAPSDEPLAPPEGLRVLVVEDEEAVGSVLATWFERSGSRVEVVERAEEALELLLDDPAWDVVVSDLRMPGMGGEGLVRALRDRRPELLERVVVTSGDAVSQATARLFDEYGLPFLAKPYRLEELSAVLRRLTGTDRPTPD